MTQPKQQPYPRFLPDRYEIRNGKFGPYFHDKRGAVDMPLLEVLATLNRYALRKDQLRWYVETYGGPSIIGATPRRLERNPVRAKREIYELDGDGAGDE